MSKLTIWNFSTCLPSCSLILLEVLCLSPFACAKFHLNYYRNYTLDCRSSVLFLWSWDAFFTLQFQLWPFLSIIIALTNLRWYFCLIVYFPCQNLVQFLVAHKIYKADEVKVQSKLSSLKCLIFLAHVLESSLSYASCKF